MNTFSEFLHANFYRRVVRRDYRFFEPDMLHPNSVAVDYIWDKVMGTMFSDEAMHTMAKVSMLPL